MWFNKDELNKRIEGYLNNRDEDIDFSFCEPCDARGRFAIRSGRRLVNTFDLYKKHECGLSDFLGALRCYLLTLKIQAHIESVDIPEQNSFGILRDVNGNDYYATLELPSYVNEEFVSDAFNVLEYSSTDWEKGYDLHTNPFIRNLTGFYTYKTLAQKLAVSGALSTPAGYSTLISLPTGGGKSLITQTMAYQQEGLTIAIVPTVSLSIDQVRVAKKTIRSSSIDDEVFYYRSGVDPTSLIEAIDNRAARILFISPEALMMNVKIKEAIARANKSRYLKNIVIDEAHIVVDWGALFRVDYQCLECWRKDLLLKNPDIRTVLLSATLEEHCSTILRQLFSKSGDRWIEIRCDSLRHEPRFMHVKAHSKEDKEKKAIELVMKLPHPLVAYVASPYEANHFISLLKERGIRNVKAYTGHTSGPDRQNFIDEWADDKLEIMIATSAFGVGVDKSDVRTVLHLYVPENANAYYQELGRGGRDGLPCLSVMCTITPDIASSFSRISKRVLTSEKIIGRWSSMYRSPTSTPIDDLIYVDTAVKPVYSDDDPFDDIPASERHKTWNIYVLLFLRRNGLLEICDIRPEKDRYVFVVRILDERLRSIDDDLKELVNDLREEEWGYYATSFETIKRTVRKAGKECWSEMFFDTYRYVSEYCAGCDEHTKPNNYDIGEFPLKKRLSCPLKELDKEQLALFGGAENLIVIANPSEQHTFIRSIDRYRISALITMDEADVDSLINQFNRNANFIVLNDRLLKELVNKKATYFLSGLIVVRYGKGPKEVLSLQRYILTVFDSRPYVKVVHVIEDNYYFDSIGKRFTDIVDGPVKPVHTII